MQTYLIIGRGYDYKNSGEKLDYTNISIPQMKKTGQFLQEYEFRFLAKPKACHDFTTEHFILWEKNGESSPSKYYELFQLLETFSQADYTFWRNAVSRQTVPCIIHYHIAKFKDMDQGIATLI